MKNIVFYFLVLIIFTGCSNGNKEQSINTETDSTQVLFFPVTSFLKGQMLQFDSLQLTPLQIVTQQKKVDSIWVKKENIQVLLKDFISVEINSSNLLPYFTASKFNDQSTDAITFTYTPKKALPDSISLRHWDVYITPQTGQVRKVYMVKQFLKNDSSYTEQLTWETDKSARITTILNLPGGVSNIVKDEKLIWKF
jgi:hypothetical protein